MLVLSAAKLPAGAMEDPAELWMQASRVAVPTILWGTLAFSSMFSVYLWLGRKISECAAAEHDLREKKSDPKAAQTYPRKVTVVVLFNAISFTYVAECAASILLDVLAPREAATARREGILDLVLLIVTSAVYTLGGMRLIFDKADNATGKAIWKTFPAVTAPSASIQLLAASCVRDAGRSMSFFMLTFFPLARLIFGTLLALAFLRRFHPSPDAKNGPHPGETEPLLANHRPNAVPSATDGHPDEDPIEGKKEEEAVKPPRNLDMLAVLVRVRRLLPFLAPLKSRIVQGVVCLCIVLTLCGNFASVLVYRQLGHIVNDINDGRSPYLNIFYWVLLQVMIADRYAGLLGISRRCLWMPVDLLSARLLTISSFRHALGLSARYHSARRTGELLSVLSRSESVADFLDFIIFQLVPIFIDMGVGLAYFSLVYGWTLAAVLTLTGCAYAAVTIWTRPHLLAMETRKRDYEDTSAGIKNESIASIELVKYMAAEAYELSRLEAAVARTQSTSLELDVYRAAIEFNSFLVTHLGVLVSATLVAAQIRRGQQDLGAFVTFTAYLFQMNSLIEQIGWMTNYTNRLMAGTEALMRVMDESNEIVDRSDAVELVGCRGDIAFEEVTFSYEEADADVTKPRKTLDGVSFTISKGQHVAIVGPAGSGKSTIFRLLFRFFDVQEGSVKVHGRDVREYTQASLRKSLGIVQQEASLFNDTIHANIKYGDITASDEKVIAAAKAAKIHDRIAEWPKKYQTQVGDRGVKLSGGEKQRVSIARTILKNADVLLLDESTSALDTSTEREIQAELRKLTEGKTVIAIAHRLSTIAASDKIIVLEKGKVVEEGHHTELIKIENGYYKKLWDAQIASGIEVKEEDSSMAAGTAAAISSASHS